MMKKVIVFTMVVFILGGLCLMSCEVLAQGLGRKGYKTRWEEAETKYKKENKVRTAQERKHLYTRVYFELGKEYYTLEDYASALVSFRRVISLEEASGQKEYTEMAKEYLEEIEKRLPRQIEKQYSVTYGKDFERLKKGIDFILEQKPEPEPLPEEEVVSEEAADRQEEGPQLVQEESSQTVVVMVPAQIQDPKLQKIDHLRQQVDATQEDLEKDRELMKLALQKEILQSKQEIEKMIYQEKIRQVGNRAEVENRMLTLKKLYDSSDYVNALPEAKTILELDPSNRTAKRIKEIIETKMSKEREGKIRQAKQAMFRRQEAQERARRKQEREEEKLRKKEEAKAARKRKEEERKKREEEKQAKEEAERQKQLVLEIQEDLEEAQEYILREDYTRATSRLKEVLKIDPNHPEALRLKQYIEMQLQGITQQLQTY